MQKQQTKIITKNSIPCIIPEKQRRKKKTKTKKTKNKQHQIKNDKNEKAVVYTRQRPNMTKKQRAQAWAQEPGRSQSLVACTCAISAHSMLLFAVESGLVFLDRHPIREA